MCKYVYIIFKMVRHIEFNVSSTRIHILSAKQNMNVIDYKNSIWFFFQFQFFNQAQLMRVPLWSKWDGGGVR